jgi:4-carboxymuconolactone decarboxylase
MDQSERAKRGMETVKAVFGEVPPMKADSLRNPDFRRVAMEHVMGDIWSRPALGLRDRAMITLAANAVLGNERELRIHLHGALHLGITREQIAEMMLHLAHYGGFPVCAMALHVAEEIFDEIDRDKAQGTEPT